MKRASEPGTPPSGGVGEASAADRRSRPALLSGARVALTCSGLFHVRRGVETWSREAFAALRERGVEVTLFAGSPDPAASPESTNGAVRVVSCVQRGSRLSDALARRLPKAAWRAGLGSAYQTEQTTFALSLLGRITHRFAIVHTKDPQVALIMQAARRLGLSRAKVILNHGTEEPPAFLRRFDYIQHLAPVHVEEARAAGVHGKGQFAVPNFVETERFRPGSGAAFRAAHGIPHDALVVLCVAAIKRHHKRIDYLLQELARVSSIGQPERPVHLLLVGARTGETDELLRVGRELLGARLHVLVDEPAERMPDVYRAADLFVLCSLREMLANASLEALASGVPCLMHRDPVAAWAIGDGGLLLDMTAAGALAAAIAAAAQPEMRRALAACARAHAVSRFSKASVIDQQLAMYEAVLRG
jgi:glycosyltransferase involved in cell wall biosynthesis